MEVETQILSKLGSSIKAYVNHERLSKNGRLRTSVHLSVWLLHGSTRERYRTITVLCFYILRNQNDTCKYIYSLKISLKLIYKL